MSNPLLALRMTLAFSRIVRDPNRLDVVFDLVDGIASDPQSVAELEGILANAEIARAAQQRIRVPDLDLDRLAELPVGSVGFHAARFFRAHGLDPAALPRREASTDVDWLSAHLYETHDLWHVLTGFGPDVAGELGLQAFYAAQVEGRVALAIMTAGLMNTLIYAPHERRQRLSEVSRGYRMGDRAHNIVGLDWGAILGRPLAEVRRELAIDVPARARRHEP